jgi:hypothetical protein
MPVEILASGYRKVMEKEQIIRMYHKSKARDIHGYN